MIIILNFISKIYSLHTSKRSKLFRTFLAVQNSSIGDLVTHSMTHSLTDSGYFYFWHTKSNPRDLWVLRHLIRVMRRHDLTEKYGKNLEPFGNLFGSFLQQMTPTILERLVTFETLITTLTIENLIHDNLCHLTIKSDTGQHLQILQCFIKR